MTRSSTRARTSARGKARAVFRDAAPLKEMVLAVFRGATVVYRGPTMWPTWEGAPLVSGRAIFPITTITATTNMTTNTTEPVQGRLGMGGGQ